MVKKQCFYMGSQFFDTIILYHWILWSYSKLSATKSNYRFLLIKTTCGALDTPIVYLVVYWIKGNRNKNVLSLSE